MKVYEMKRVSKMVEKVEEWLGLMTYDYLIQDVNPVYSGNAVWCDVFCAEYDPDGRYETYTLTIRGDGTILNKDKANVIEVQKDACDNDPIWLEKIRKFEEEWRVEE